MNYQLGDIIEGQITGIKPYGLFIKFEDKYGFCHISNASKRFIKNLNDEFSLNQTVKAKIVQIDDKFNVSIKEVESDNISDKHRTIQNKSKRGSNINNNKESFEDMLKHFLKNSDEKIDSINKRTKKHTKR